MRTALVLTLLASCGGGTEVNQDPASRLPSAPAEDPNQGGAVRRQPGAAAQGLAAEPPTALQEAPTGQGGAQTPAAPQTGQGGQGEKSQAATGTGGQPAAQPDASPALVWADPNAGLTTIDKTLSVTHTGEYPVLSWVLRGAWTVGNVVEVHAATAAGARTATACAAAAGMANPNGFSRVWASDPTAASVALSYLDKGADQFGIPRKGQDACKLYQVRVVNAKAPGTPQATGIGWAMAAASSQP